MTAGGWTGREDGAGGSKRRSDKRMVIGCLVLDTEIIQLDRRQNRPGTGINERELGASGEEDANETSLRVRFSFLWCLDRPILDATATAARSELLQCCSVGLWGLHICVQFWV